MTITCTDTKGNKYACKVTMNMPNVKCEMLSTVTYAPSSTTYYFKKFKLSNWSGKTVWLADKLIMYWPYSGDTDTSDIMFGMNSVYSTKTFSDSSEDVQNGYSYTFVGFEGSYSNYYPAYSNRMFAMALTVGSHTYTCIFSTDGPLLSVSQYS